MSTAQSTPTPKSTRCPHCTGLLRPVRDGNDTYIRCLNCGRIITEDDFRSAHAEDPEPTSREPDPIDLFPPPPQQISDDLQELTAIRWPDAITCPYCLSRRVQQIIGAVEQSIMCNACDRVFDVRTKTPMADTDIPDAVWLACLQALARGPQHFDIPTIAADLQPHHRSRVQEAHDIVMATSTNPDLAPTTRHFLKFRHPAPLPPRPEPRPTDRPDRPPGEQTQMLSPTTIVNDAPDPDDINPPAEADVPPADPDPEAQSQPSNTDPAGAAPTPEDELRAAQMLTQLRWPHGIVCPKCGSNDVTTNWKLRIPNHCRGCSSKFSLRTNSLTHKSSTTCFEWLQILEMFAERPSQAKHIRELGNSRAIASNINRRIKTAIQLWNQRHGQKRRTLSPSEILSVHYLWGQGEETEYRPPDAAPTTSNDTQQPAAPPPPEPPADPDPTTAAVAHDPDPEPDPQPDAEPDSPADVENAPDVNDDEPQPEPQSEPTIQQVLDLLTQLDHRIASLESPAVPARQANHSCPVCRFDDTNPADRPGFTACTICGCVFPNAFPTAFPVQNIEIQKPPAASPHYDPVPLINITIQRG